MNLKKLHLFYILGIILLIVIFGSIFVTRTEAFQQETPDLFYCGTNGQLMKYTQATASAQTSVITTPPSAQTSVITTPPSAQTSVITTPPITTQTQPALLPTSVPSATRYSRPMSLLEEETPTPVVVSTPAPVIPIDRTIPYNEGAVNTLINTAQQVKDYADRYPDYRIKSETTYIGEIDTGLGFLQQAKQNKGWTSQFATFAGVVNNGTLLGIFLNVLREYQQLESGGSPTVIRPTTPATSTPVQSGTTTPTKLTAAQINAIRSQIANMDVQLSNQALSQTAFLNLLRERINLERQLSQNNLPRIPPPAIVLTRINAGK